MNTLAQGIAWVCGSLIVGYLAQFLKPRVKISYWFPHTFVYRVPWNIEPRPQQALPPAGDAQVPAGPLPGGVVNVLTHSVTVQNFGRKTAAWVEIVHRTRPEFFQFYPALDYSEKVTLAGEHVLRINSVAPKEWFTIQFLSYLQAPELLYVRSPVGQASPLQWMPVRRLSQWVYILQFIFVATGVAFYAYWLLRAAIFVFHMMQRH